MSEHTVMTLHGFLFVTLSTALLLLNMMVGRLYRRVRNLEIVVRQLVKSSASKPVELTKPGS